VNTEKCCCGVEMCTWALLACDMAVRVLLHLCYWDVTMAMRTVCDVQVYTTNTVRTVQHK